MELIQIIYYVVVFGGAFFLTLLLFLYFVSKSRNGNSYRNVPAYQSETRSMIQVQVEQQRRAKSQLETQMRNQSEQLELRKNDSNKPLIFNIDQTQPRELKIVRKPTFREENNKTKGSDELGKNGNGVRYKIVNEEQNRSKFHAANFYL